MKRKHKILAILALFGMLSTNFAGCGGCNGNKPTDTTPTVTIAPTEAPTAAPTEKPTATPVVEETVTPIPSPTAIPTPEPTATPEPTTTPEPTPVIKVDENAKLLDSVKMGDNVWYDIYDDGTLVVRGTGKTKDLILPIEHTVEAIDIKLVDTVIIEEGITELGEYSLGTLYYATKVVFPKSLKKIGGLALYAIGDMAEEIDYIGLDTDKVEIDATSFLGCGNPEKIKDAEKYTAMPTPTPVPPTPTPTPKPDPNKPRVFESRKMGDNVTFEFYDNGYLYVRGTGATYDFEWNYSYGRTYEELYKKIHSVVVEEGVTYLGHYVFTGDAMRNISYYSLPKSLTHVGSTGGGGDKVTFDCYIDGKPATVKTHNAVHTRSSVDALYNNLFINLDKALANGYEIIYK